MKGIKRKHFNCQRCERSDHYDDMVQCDFCDDWYHFKCAEVGKEISIIEWSCKFCSKVLSETYQQAEAAKDSIVRNLELEARNVSTMKCLRRDNVHRENVCCGDENPQRTTTHLNADEIDKLISDKVESAIAQRMKDILLGPTRASVDDENHVDVPDTTAQNKSDNVAVADVAAVIETIVQDEFGVGAIDYAGITETIVLDETDAVATALSRDVVAVDDKIGVEFTAKFKNSNIESVLPIKRVDHLVELEDELIDNLDYLRQKHGKRGSEKLYTTMRIVSNSIIADEFLQDYSFKGQKSKTKQKLPLNVYPNVCKFIVLATMDAYNHYNSSLSNFVSLTEKHVEKFFITNFIKYAAQRSQ